MSRSGIGGPVGICTCNLDSCPSVEVSTYSVGNVLFSHNSTNTVCEQTFQSNGKKWDLCVVSLNVSYYEWGQAHFPLSTNVPKFTAFAHFSAGLLEFFFLTSRRSFLIRKISPLPVTWAANMFSQKLFFTLVKACFHCAEVCDCFSVSKILIFILIASWFGSLIRKAFSYSPFMKEFSCGDC